MMTATQIFDIVNMSPEMVRIVSDITVTHDDIKKHIVVAKCERALSLAHSCDVANNSETSKKTFAFATGQYERTLKGN